MEPTFLNLAQKFYDYQKLERIIANRNDNYQRFNATWALLS